VRKRRKKRRKKKRKKRRKKRRKRPSGKVPYIHGLPWSDT